MSLPIKKTVLITGSARGLGKRLALVFANHNYDIILHDRTEDDLKEIKEEISKKGVNYFTLAGDLRRDSIIDKLVEIAKEKNISILINNAAVLCPGLPLVNLSYDKIEEMIETNLLAPIKLCKKIYPIFKTRKGTIININSLAAREPKKFRTLYSASKWGLRGFANSLRLEAEEDNIKVMNIYLSKVKTKPTDSFGMDAMKVSKRIYEFYKEGGKKYQELIIDGRPKKYRADISEQVLIIDGKDYESR